MTRRSTAQVDGVTSAPRDLTARGLLWAAAVGAASSTASAIPAVVGADDATKVVEAWRMYGLALFTGLFVLLALRPRRHRGVWVLVIANKLALTITGLVLLSGDGVRDAGTIAAWDGALSVLLITAYISCRGWRPAPSPGA